MIVIRTSPITQQINSRTIDITQKQYDDWKNGMLIQNAMPNISVDEREFIMTGLTPDDWQELFGKDESDV